jgi:hypothetical protein
VHKGTIRVLRRLTVATSSGKRNLGPGRHKKEPRAVDACRGLQVVASACRLLCPSGEGLGGWGVVARMGLLIRTSLNSTQHVVLGAPSSNLRC